ncbi:MAG: hypothetical protein GTO02_08565, partial [Candidatus Dadabacteria bacterium]|nr:hypothetical protein [Candidatus Dadabacteria bacterium]NIQ14438.1 hypothetical protein [Candidatus Dadabacteria bacterium]
KNPSFTLFKDKTGAKCFGCEKSTDVISLEEKLGNHPSPFEAVKALSGRHNIGIKFSDYQDQKTKEDLSRHYKLMEWFCNEA